MSNFMKTKIESRLKEFIAQNLLFTDDGDSLADSTSLLAAGIVDSMGVMQLVEFVHEAFGFEVPMEEITPENFDSIERLTRYIERKRSARTTADSND
jgi:acyl carrier protein